jgi:mycofactocin precursor
MKNVKMEKEPIEILKTDNEKPEEPQIIEEIVIEELSIDGVCGVY